MEVLVAVIGLGGLGQWALKLLPFVLGREGVKTIGIDINSKKIDFVKKLQLSDETFCICPEDTSEEQVGKFRSEFGSKPNIILDFVNSRNSFSLSTQLLEKGGVHIMVGLHGGQGELKLPLEVVNASSHIGNLVGSLVELKELLELVNRHNISSPQVKQYRLEEATRALLDLEAGLIEGRAVLTFNHT